VSISGGGEGICPYHKRVKVKWMVKGDYTFRASKKALKIDEPRAALGKIDCPALSEDGSRCQMDLGPCSADQIIEYFALGKPVRGKY